MPGAIGGRVSLQERKWICLWRERQRQTETGQGETVERGKEGGREKGGMDYENEMGSRCCTFGYRRKQHHIAGQSGATIKKWKAIGF